MVYTYTTFLPLCSSLYVTMILGGSRGNPGLSGCGAILFDDKMETVWKESQFVGSKATNNQAEYAGLILGLKAAVEREVTSLEIEGDSLLVVKQIAGEYKVRSAGLKPLHAEAMKLLAKIPQWSARNIPREENGLADELANNAMDQARSHNL